MNTFDIIGQSALISGLKSILDSGRVVHSYIFTGPAGAGKKTISNFFAKALLCEGQDRPCNTCLSCRQFDSTNHPDVIRVKSDKKTIGIDLTREIRADIGIKPFQNKWKIYIIEKGGTMTPQAQNALLKTLEEPPKYAIIMILADNLASLLPTIVSRCQHVRIPRLSAREVATIIEKKMDISSEEAIVFAKLSEGLPGKGLELAGSQEYQQMRNESLKVLEKLSQNTLIESMEHIDYFQENRDNIMDILDMFELWMRDILVLKQSSYEDVLINMDKLAQLESLANIFTTHAIQCIIDDIENSKKMLMSHANFQLTIENLLMNIQGSDEYAQGSRSTVQKSR